MATTDYLQLNGQKILDEFRSGLPKFTKAQNVLTVKDDMLYMWDFQNSCIIVLNIKAARSKKNSDVPYQTLLPTRSPLFVPDALTINENNTLIIASGDTQYILPKYERIDMFF